MWAFAVHVVVSSIKVPSVGCCGVARWTCASFCSKSRVQWKKSAWSRECDHVKVVDSGSSSCSLGRLMCDMLNSAVVCFCWVFECCYLVCWCEWMCPVLLGLRKFGWWGSPEIYELSYIFHWSRCKGRVFVQLIMDVLLYYRISWKGWSMRL